ncbi:MAG: hypothetical protein EOO38_18225 [Cytophagaceae bacterium]|nr:MAG: hypothetical protein EOO38_18225 [Cytophagaceae bacterium]
MLVYHQQIPADDRVPLLLTDGPFGRQFAAWFSEHRPEVVVSQEWQVMRVLDSLGLRVPHDVGFAHLAVGDDEHHWAGMNQNSELVGSAAVDLVDAQLRRNERGIPNVPKTVLIPGYWVAGPTVRRVDTPVAVHSLDGESAVLAQKVEELVDAVAAIVPVCVDMTLVVVEGRESCSMSGAWCGKHNFDWYLSTCHLVRLRRRLHQKNIHTTPLCATMRMLHV